MVAKNNILNKVISGYQGWFSCRGDDSPRKDWVHWSRGKPGPGNQSFELWPDIREYRFKDLYPTNYGDLGNGKPAMLFTSYSQDVIDTHFKWMQEYGVDVAALQRFGVSLNSREGLIHNNSVRDKARKAAEKYDREFYLMYDISGMEQENFIDKIKQDWEKEIQTTLGLTSSSQYLRANNKPVVCLWGFGFTDRPGTTEQAENLITYFHKQGCFVIGGVPTNWRISDGDSKKGWLETYLKFDMISPWTVGRYKDEAGIREHFENILQKDHELCEENNILYLPVVFPGFAWSTWNGGSKNAIPRRGGNHFWQQIYYINQAGIKNIYVAMFDEYDEATAIAKAAENNSMTPSNQYFLTLDEDGVEMSSDFYLRLTGAAGKVIKGEKTATYEVPIPYFEK